VQVLKQLVTGKDKYGRDVPRIDSYTTLLGVPVDPLMALLVRSSVPFIDKIDKQNIGNKFGVQQHYDPYTMKTVMAQPSWAGADRVTKSASDIPPSGVPDFLGEVGFKPGFFDYAVAAGYNESDIIKAIKDATKQVREQARKSVSNSSPEAAKKAELEMQALIKTREQLIKDYEDFKGWRERMGLPSSDAMRYLKENPNMTEQTMPVE
jgi:hypothetical protein